MVQIVAGLLPSCGGGDGGTLSRNSCPWWLRSDAPQHPAGLDRGRPQPSLGLSEVSAMDPELGAGPQPRGARREVGSTQKAQSY